MGARDPAIKLFGKTIPLPQEEEKVLGNSLSLKEGKEEQVDEKEFSGTKPTETKNKVGKVSPVAKEQTGRPATSLGNNESQNNLSAVKETSTDEASKAEEEQSETGNSQDKALKKPDKIVPCPRCNSMDTKFCYYNNYNVNQPRHFCKNCQRYWTAGGTMRNVPVGAGRRKNKNSGSLLRHISVSEVLQTARANVSDGIHHPALKHNGAVLTFGTDNPHTPLCESMVSVLNLAEKTTQNSTYNGFQRPDEVKVPSSFRGGENSDQNLSRSSVTNLNPREEQAMRNFHGFPPHIPCVPGAPWAYSWNSMPPPNFCPPTFPPPFYHAPYWGCVIPGNWSFPWPLPPPLPLSPNSPTLGKHSREGDILKPSIAEKEDPTKQNSSERCLWIPKTLRIDDPGEAARSSIWATLGIKNDSADSTSAGGLFKAFELKAADRKNHMEETSHVLQANPAALSRSFNFHESSS